MVLGGYMVPGGCLVRGGVPGPGGCAWSGGCMVSGVPGGDPPRMATAVGGMYPTGMHSCYDKKFEELYCFH